MSRAKACRKEYGFGGVEDVPEFFLIKLPPATEYTEDCLDELDNDLSRQECIQEPSTSSLYNQSPIDSYKDELSDKYPEDKMDDRHNGSTHNYTDTSYSRGKSRNDAPLVLTSGPLPAKLKWFNEEKGFGFVTVEDTGNNKAEDLFIHITAFTRAGIQSAPPLGTKLTVWKGKGKGDKEAALQVEVPPHQ